MGREILSNDFVAKLDAGHVAARKLGLENTLANSLQHWKAALENSLQRCIERPGAAPRSLRIAGGNTQLAD